MTNISDDRLRALYAPIAEQPRGDRLCPSPEDLQALVQRQGDEDARLAILDHVMTCAPCRNEFNVLRAVEKAGRQLEAESVSAGSSDAVSSQPVTQPAIHGSRGSANGARNGSSRTHRGVARSRWTWTVSAIAAAAVLAVGLQSRRSAAENDVVRGIDDPVTLIAPIADAVADGRTPIRFVWNSVPRTTEYQLEVLDSAGHMVFTTTTTDTTAVFVDTEGKIDPSMSHRWWVKASMPDGNHQRSALRVLQFAKK